MFDDDLIVGLAQEDLRLWPKIRIEDLRCIAASALLGVVLKPYGMTVSSAGEHLNVTRQALSRMLNRKDALRPDMAARFEKAFGIRLPSAF